MVGLGTRLLVAKQVASALSAAGAPEGALIAANERWYYFGALGPAIGDFVPFEPPVALGAPGRSPYYSIWRSVFRIAVGDGTPVPPLPGVVPVLRTFKEFLDKVSALVAAQDFDAMKDLRDSGQLDVVKQAGKDLGQILQTFSDPSQLKDIGELMGVKSKPAILNDTLLVPPSRWTGRDWLHWKRPGTFASELRQRALASGDDRFVAYALGWVVSYAALVCGSGFMASLVGSSYRNHWWRSRWIGNFVDTWVWGFYGANAHMVGDDPSPSYPAWPALCDAKLHDWIDLTNGLAPEDVARLVVEEQPLPEVLPPAFAKLWIDSWNAAYKAAPPELFTAERLQVAYLMLWTVLWFQTSGDVIGCNVAPPLTPPGACGDNPAPPDWVDPTQTNPATGQPFQPPTPNAEHDPDEAEIVSGIVLALAGLAGLFFGGGIAGAAALAGGIGMIIDGVKQLNWDELECQLYWLRMYLYNGLAALHKITVFGGLQHPYPADLAADELVVEFNGGKLSYASGASTCQSRGMEGLHLPWGGFVSTWTSYPTNPLEEPLTDVWSLSGLWPSAVVDDVGANPASEDLSVPPPVWPGGVKGSFGPAVPAAVQLVTQPGQLPDWNLDGDRGRGWLTWELAAPYASPVAAVPEA